MRITINDHIERMFANLFELVLLSPQKSPAIGGDTIGFGILGQLFNRIILRVDRDRQELDIGVFQRIVDAIEFIIDDTTPDQFPESNRGAFAGGTTVVSIPEAGINSAVSTNIDGLFLQDFGSTILNLVSTNNFFGSVALGLIWNQSGVLGSVDSINPISDSAPDPNAAQGGLTLQFAGGQPNVTLNSVSSARLTTQIAAVPEPSGSMLMMVFAFAMSWQRKRPRKKFVA